MPEPTSSSDDDAEVSYERECPYFARYYNFAGHDPAGTCAFGCSDEPGCVTSSWLDEDEFAALKAEFEAAHIGRDANSLRSVETPDGNGRTDS